VGHVSESVPIPYLKGQRQTRNVFYEAYQRQRQADLEAEQEAKPKRFGVNWGAEMTLRNILGRDREDASILLETAHERLRNDEITFADAVMQDAWGAKSLDERAAMIVAIFLDAALADALELAESVSETKGEAVERMKDAWTRLLHKRDYPSLETKRTISYVTRRKVLERDGFRCVICGSDHNPQVDHVVPESLGGSRHEDNLQTLCEECNNKKRAKL
jgi:hypothetical protein